MAEQTADSALARRWYEADAEGLTRRDAVLRELKSSGRTGETDLRCINLNGEDLRDVDLSRCDLSCAQLGDPSAKPW